MAVGWLKWHLKLIFKCLRYFTIYISIPQWLAFILEIQRSGTWFRQVALLENDSTFFTLLLLQLCRKISLFSAALKASFILKCLVKRSSCQLVQDVKNSVERQTIEHKWRKQFASWYYESDKTHCSDGKFKKLRARRMRCSLKYEKGNKFKMQGIHGESRK